MTTVNILLKRTGTPSKRPVASVIDIGSVCLNYDVNTGGLFYKASDSTVIKVGPCQVSADAPNSAPAGSPGNSAGEFWYDTSDNVLKVFDGSVWRATGAGATLTGIAPIVVNNASPANPIISVTSATTSAQGVVQLTNSITSTSQSLALTAAAGSVLNNLIAGATATANNAVSLATTANTNASTALTTANNAEIVATTAQSTANTALANAATAQSTANTNTTNIGPLSNLQTSDKSSIVNAINEQEVRIDLLGSALIYGGTYNASTNLVASVTQAGTDAGLTIGNPLPTGAVTSNVFVIITVQGTGVFPAPPLLLEVGNWLVSNGTDWDYLQLGIPQTTADLVQFTPFGSISATNVQDALEEVDTEKVPKTTQVIAGGGLTGGGSLVSDVTVTLPTTGVVAGTYGSDGQIPQVQVDTYGRITNIVEIAASLGGLDDVDLTTVPPVADDILQYNGTLSVWEPKTLSEAEIPTFPEVNATNNRIAFVDKATGNDATGVVGDMTKPYSTIKAALAAASVATPAVVMVSEGVYNEVNPLIVPSNVQIVGKAGTLGWVQTEIIPTVNTEDVILMTGNGAGVTGVTVTVPLTADKGAIVYDGPNGSTGSVTFTGIRGQTGSNAVGIYCRCATTGKIISFENRYRGGNMDSLLRVDGGILANESTHVPNTPVGGGPRAVFLQKNNLGAPISRLQAANANSGNSNVQHVFETAGGTAVFFGVNWFFAANGIHITSNNYNIQINGGVIDCTTSLIVDVGLTGSNGSLFVSAQMKDSFEYPFTWSDSNYQFEFNTKSTDNEVKGSAKVLQGSDLIIGENHRGNGMSVGRGGPSKVGMRVLTSDATASSTTDGSNITDVTAAAVDKTGNPFTFQGTAANHCIYFGTTEDDATGITLKHTGLDISVISGDLVGTYVVEIWNGVVWTEVGVQAVSEANGYSYANNLFWRNNSEEDIFYGIRPATPWATKTIGGITCYWSRVRIVTPPTTLPSFLTVWLLPAASTTFSSEGVMSKMGFSQFGVVNTQGSNIFTEQGTVVNYSFTMGPGGPTSYTHSIANIQIGSVGEGLYWQTAIVPAICTALPLYVDIGYSLTSAPSTTAPVFNLYFTPIETAGTLIADPAGSIVPIIRPESLTTPFTGVGSIEPIRETISLPFTEADKLNRVRFGPFNISDFYEGDAIAIFFECVTTGTPSTNINVWGVAVIGYQWTDGIRGY